MGNEQSQFSGIDIDEKAVEISDFWTQHSASISSSENISNLTVFTGELLVNGPLWKTQTPLERTSKNLMIYRHPCILKYISSWPRSSKCYLAVEEVTPLSQVLSSLNNLQICIGIHSILKALCFLHDTAHVSHNNVCIASIYVSKEGNWKLGAMEYLCKFSDLSSDYLTKSKTNRYNKAIDPNETDNIQKYLDRKDFVDVYAFGVFTCEILKSKQDDTIPTLSSFYNLCKNDLQNMNVAQRPKLSSLLNHDFFCHDFIAIHSFLLELPLKSDEEKTEFFSTLTEKIKNFQEVTVASEFSALLLSRMVLLNKTAQTDLLPFLLTPRKEDQDQSKGMFTVSTFKKYLAPKLLEIFKVRDAQIRLLLLNNFHNFMEIFTKDELQNFILPELLLGIKDTNDHLVSVTLRTLADLVPLLGAATVIGGKRAKLFNDGRPTQHLGRKLLRKKQDSVSIRESSLPIVHDTDPLSLENSATELNNIVDFLERPRPDGEEGETSTEEVEQSVDEDLDNWEDWDINEHNHSNNPAIAIEDRTELQGEMPIYHGNKEESSNANNPDITIPTVNNERVNKKTMVDITELDIKNQLNNDNCDEFDFFQDMEPVIDSTNKFVINKDVEESNLSNEISSKLNVSITDDIKEEGWGDDDWE